MEIGNRLGPYEILAPIGAGGMGEVYRARDTRLDRDVAVKVLPAGFVADADRLRRFEQEARAAGALNHPNILVIHDVGTTGAFPYVVSELLEGETLRERLREGSFSLRKAIRSAVQIAQGLAAAHDKGIVHRDLKPENLFVTTDGRLKILDFGLAKLTQGARSSAEMGASTVGATEPGIVLGTAGYMSPEQVRGLPADHRADIFSLGVILYELLSGTRAFHRDSAAETMTAILNEEPPALDSVKPVPAGLARIVERCLEKRPEERFQSARDLGFALEAASSGSSAQSIATTGVTGRRGTALRALAATALAAIVAAAAFVGGRYTARSDHASFQPLTFRRGTLNGARFAPDGRTIVYSAAWDASASDVFTTRSERPESRSMGLPPAIVLSVSSKGELAILLTADRNLGTAIGTLARLPMIGGTPRPLLEGVYDADWAPDGERLCVLRRVQTNEDQIEFPIGQVLVRGSVRFPRVSPRGDRVAYSGEEGIEVVDLSGRRTVLSTSPPFRYGLAWSPRGDEVWFTAGEQGTNRALYAVDLSGKQRLVSRTPGSLNIHDVSTDGRVLLSQGFGRFRVAVCCPGGASERELAVLTRSRLSGLAADGQAVLISEGAEIAGGLDGVPYLLSTDGAQPLRLGVGRPLALSPDAKRALCFLPSPPRLIELPTGPGDPRPVDLAGLTPCSYPRCAAWSADGQRLFLVAREEGRPPRVFVKLRDKSWQAVTPEAFITADGWAIAPRGDKVAARDPGGSVSLYSVDGAPPRPLAGELGTPVHWSADGAWLYLREPGDSPARVYRRNLLTDRVERWKDLLPGDAAAVVSIEGPMLTADGRTYAYGVNRVFNDLYLAVGLK
ncbi:MAG: protein kinase domain-containing protein [Vicinamibacterales bacterium]